MVAMNSILTQWQQQFPGKQKPLLMTHHRNHMSFSENFVRAFRQAIESGSGILETNFHLSCYGTFLRIRERIVSRIGDSSSRAKKAPLLEPKYLKPMTDDERINIQKTLAFEELADFYLNHSFRMTLLPLSEHFSSCEKISIGSM